jgi:hypothetical protein
MRRPSISLFQHRTALKAVQAEGQQTVSEAQIFRTIEAQRRVLGDDARILGLLRERWIDYPRATQALQQLERLYEAPHRNRMPCLILHGDSNIGKMKITAKFPRAHPNAFDDRSGVERCSVVAMQMPPTPDQHRSLRLTVRTWCSA